MLFDGQENSGDAPIGVLVTDGPLDRGGFDEFHGFITYATDQNLDRQ